MTFNVSEFGRRLIVNANYNLAAYSQLELVFTRPDGSMFIRTNPAITISASPLVTLDAGTLAANEYVMYTMQLGDLTVPGDYLVRLSYTDATPMHLVGGGTSFTVSS